MKAALNETDALIVVDMQNDFCPGGALPVQAFESTIPTLNRWMAAADQSGAMLVASRDWHPPNHLSFEEQGGKWPAHCVQETHGAEFHGDLELPTTTRVVSKGTEPDRDCYSALAAENLAQELHEAGIQRVWIGGVALDVCVRATALDAVEAGFEVHLLLDGSSPVDQAAAEQTVQELEKAGVFVETGYPSE